MSDSQHTESGGQSIGVRPLTRSSIAPLQQQSSIRLSNLNSFGSAQSSSSTGTSAGSQGPQSEATASSPQSTPIPLASTPPSGSDDGHGKRDLVLNLLNSSVTVVALVVVVAFGTGAWLGMNYANKIAAQSYQLSLWGTCYDHDVSFELPYQASTEKL
jgi:hypothetical protein